MDTHRFFVEKIRFHLKEKNTVVFVGWFFDGSAREHALAVSLDEKELQTEFLINTGAEVRQKYLGAVNEIKEEVVGVVRLPENWREYRRFMVKSAFGPVKGQEAGRGWSKAYSATTRKLRRLETELNFYIENCHREKESVTVTGWCMPEGETKLVLLDASGQELPQKVDHYFRKDLRSVYPECSKELKPGFLVRAEVPESSKGPFFLEMRSADKRARARLRKWDEGNTLQFLLDKTGDTVRYLERNGLSATLYKINGKLRGREETSYDKWRRKYDADAGELARQRQETFSFSPLFSVVVPLYKTKPGYLCELIDSVCRQTYPHWQLVLADGSRDADGGCWTELTGILERYAGKDSRIFYRTLERNGGIAENTNAALAMAEGDFIVLADHDDLLAENALYEFAAALNRDRAVDVIYSDEDKVSMDGKKYFEPHLKPDFNIDLLCSVNYICHLFAVSRKIADGAGGFRSEYEGAQDLDFILRCCEQAENVCHVPKVLYHWRSHMGSTAASPESKLYAFEAGRRAVEAHYRRLGIPARVENAVNYGMYRTRYEWGEQPLVSIIIPNKDHASDLKKCVDSVFEKSEYRNFEFVIVENNSVESGTFSYYEELQKMHENVRVVYYEGGFNYSKINNFGARAAKGDFFLLLNNDTEMIGKEAISELLGYCMRADVGIVGAKLLFADDTIQHAGVILGFGGTAGHAFIGKPRYDTRSFGRILCAQDYSAVTAACMMTKRSVYEQAGGLTEELAVAFNDVDYCLKVRRMGKLVVYNPYAEFYHYESKSRGYEDSPEKVERFQGEVEILLSRWRREIEQGDPYYNPGLTLDDSDFSLHR